MKYNFSKKLAITTLALSSVMLASSVQASTLSGTLNIDDEYTAYISETFADDGVEFSTNDKWFDTTSFSGVSLTAGTDYYLHVKGNNADDFISGFIGDVTISGGDHVFMNGTSFVTTASSDWTVGGSTWGTDAVVERSASDSALWNGIAGTRTGIDAAATWIWDTTANIDNDEAYFTMKISAVPVPGAVWLFGTGLLGFVGMRKKKA